MMDTELDVHCWSSRFKPFFLHELFLSHGLKKKFVLMIKKMILPNIILCGPPGSGKSSSICCLSKKLFSSNYAKHVLTLNASDDRGVQVIREKIKIFCQKKLRNDTIQKKLVILDEADSLTKTAQEALRRTMEIFSDGVRFALICNFPSKIIEPIQSRCAILRFTKIQENFIFHRLVYILNNEKIFFDSNGLEAVIFITQSDMRQTLNVSQKIVELYGNLTYKAIGKFCALTDYTLYGEFFIGFSNLNMIFGKELLLDSLNNGFNILEIIEEIFLICKKVYRQEKKTLIVLEVLCKLRLFLSDNLKNTIFVNILAEKLDKTNKKFQGHLGIEPRISHTRNENHTFRPVSRILSAII